MTVLDMYPREKGQKGKRTARGGQLGGSPDLESSEACNELLNKKLIPVFWPDKILT